MEDLCNSFKYLLLDNCMAKGALILYSVCLVCHFSYWKNRSKWPRNIFFCKNRQISIQFRLDTPLRMVIVVCTNPFDLTYFQWIMQTSGFSIIFNNNAWIQILWVCHLECYIYHVWKLGSYIVPLRLNISLHLEGDTVPTRWRFYLRNQACTLSLGP